MLSAINYNQGNDINTYITRGNEAIMHGKMDECVKWYKQGLSIAKTLENKEKVKEISLLLFTLF